MWNNTVFIDYSFRSTTNVYFLEMRVHVRIYETLLETRSAFIERRPRSEGL